MLWFVETRDRAPSNDQWNLWGCDHLGEAKEKRQHVLLGFLLRLFKKRDLFRLPGQFISRNPGSRHLPCIRNTTYDLFMIISDNNHDVDSTLVSILGLDCMHLQICICIFVSVSAYGHMSGCLCSWDCFQFYLAPFLQMLLYILMEHVPRRIGGGLTKSCWADCWRWIVFMFGPGISSWLAPEMPVKCPISSTVLSHLVKWQIIYLGGAAQWSLYLY